MMKPKRPNNSLAQSCIQTVESRARDKTDENALGFLCPMKYTNQLVDPPFAPKFLPCPFVQIDRFIDYRETILEKQNSQEIHADPFVGVNIDLVDPLAYARPESTVKLHPADAKLLESDTLGPMDTQRSLQHARVVPWMRKTEYISSEYNKFGRGVADRQETKIGVKLVPKLKEMLNRDKLSKIEAISKTFTEVQKKVTKHYAKKGVYAVEELPILPDFKLWKYDFAIVRFDSDPCPGNYEEVDLPKMLMSQAQIRGMQSNGEQFVSYYCPTTDTLQKRKEDKERGILFDENHTYSHRQVRDYYWSVNQGTNFQNNFFFSFRPDGVHYNCFQSRVKLTKRKAVSQTATILTINYTNPTEEEIERMSRRLRQLLTGGLEEEFVETEEQGSDRGELSDEEQEIHEEKSEETIHEENKDEELVVTNVSNARHDSMKFIKVELSSSSDYED